MTWVFLAVAVLFVSIIAAELAWALLYRFKFSVQGFPHAMGTMERRLLAQTGVPRYLAVEYAPEYEGGDAVFGYMVREVGELSCMESEMVEAAMSTTVREPIEGVIPLSRYLWNRTRGMDPLRDLKEQRHAAANAPRVSPESKKQALIDKLSALNLTSTEQDTEHAT